MKGLRRRMVERYGLTVNGPGAGEHMFIHAGIGSIHAQGMFGYVVHGNGAAAAIVGIEAIGASGEVGKSESPKVRRSGIRNDALTYSSVTMT